MERNPCVHGLKDLILFKSDNAQIDLCIQYNSYQNLSCPFCINRQADPRIHMEMKKNPELAKIILKKRTKMEDSYSWFQNVLQGYRIQDSEVMA